MVKHVFLVWVKLPFYLDSTEKHSENCYLTNWVVDCLQIFWFLVQFLLKGDTPLLTGTLSLLLLLLGRGRKGYKTDISIQGGVTIKCVLYIYLIFITIIYGCINLTFTVLPLHIGNLTYLKMDYTDVKNQMAFEICVTIKKCLHVQILFDCFVVVFLFCYVLFFCSWSNYHFN